MTKREYAIGLFASGFSCSQAIFAAYAEELGLNQEMALKISTGFGGGMAKQGFTCGAITGAVMVISTKYGRSALEDTPSKEKTYTVILEFFKRFKDIHRTTDCRDLIGCDLMTPEGQALAKERNVHKNICENIVGSTVDILEDLLR
jgi:C_GCAxxG_C_C family probable redox protein